MKTNTIVRGSCEHLLKPQAAFPPSLLLLPLSSPPPPPPPRLGCLLLLSFISARPALRALRRCVRRAARLGLGERSAAQPTVWTHLEETWHGAEGVVWKRRSKRRRRERTRGALRTRGARALEDAARADIWSGSVVGCSWSMAAAT